MRHRERRLSRWPAIAEPQHGICDRPGRGYPGAETEDAIAEASSQLVAEGYCTPAIVLFDDSNARLREKTEEVRRLIQTQGFGARIETLNATFSWRPQLAIPPAADQHAQSLVTMIIASASRIGSQNKARLREVLIPTICIRPTIRAERLAMCMAAMR